MPLEFGRRKILGSLAAAVTLVTVAACGVSSSENVSKRLVAGKRGGTLHLLQAADFQNLDPARNYVVSQLQLGRLLYPTLTSYANASGAAGKRLVADAATDTGRSAAGGTQWTFTIRDSLRWEDGKAVTCQDYKYGVERSFSNLLPGGPRYQKQYLVGGATYQGVYTQPAGLPSVRCAGNQITYQLNRPVHDFNYAVTLPIFAAVRRDRDTKEKYGDRPFSYGPYRVGQRVADQRLELVRNPHWDQSKDTVRKNLPDVFDFRFGDEPSVITDRLIQDRGDDERAVTFGNTQVTPERATEVLSDQNLINRTVTGTSGYLWYLAVNTAKIKDRNCRLAYQYAVNKRTYLTAIGGPAYGQYANTVTLPGTPSHREFDVFGLAKKPAGDPAKARTYLAQSPTCQKKPTLDYLQTPTLDKAAAALKDGLGRIGITVQLRPIPRAQYYSTVGNPATQGDLVYASWIADWASGSTVIPPLFDGRQITPTGNQVFSNLNDKAINDGIDKAVKEPNFATAQRMWADLDEQVVRTGAVIPLRYEKALFLVGSKVTGAYQDANFSDISLSNVGVEPD